MNSPKVAKKKRQRDRHHHPRNPTWTVQRTTVIPTALNTFNPSSEATSTVQPTPITQAEPVTAINKAIPSNGPVAQHPAHNLTTSPTGQTTPPARQSRAQNTPNEEVQQSQYGTKSQTQPLLPLPLGSITPSPNSTPLPKSDIKLQRQIAYQRYDTNKIVKKIE